MKLPSMRLLFSPVWIWTPSTVLAEITLQSPVQAPPGVTPSVPPMTFALPPATVIPLPPLGAAVAPVTSVPMKFPVITLLPLAAPGMISIPSPLNPRMTNPRMLDVLV
jgi:hypothetical protein